jgi:hypothetical protein
VLFTSL